jgi:hypothetical protein
MVLNKKQKEWSMHGNREKSNVVQQSTIISSFGQLIPIIEPQNDSLLGYLLFFQLFFMA